MEIRKKSFTEKVADHWNRLPREVHTAQGLSEFKYQDALILGIYFQVVQ